MSDNSPIEWTDATWSPTTGCDRTSLGCDHCYALTLAKRLKAMGSAKYQTDGDPRTSGPGFGVAMHEDALALPLRWRKPRKIFVNSMSDLFHAKVTDEFIARVFAVILASEQHSFQVLTKRHGRMRSLLNRPEFRAQVERLALEEYGGIHADQCRSGWWPIKNLWLGVSVENQHWADIRIPALLDTPAAVRWISAEPLLGPIDLHGPIATEGPLRGSRPRLTYWLSGRPHWGPEQHDTHGNAFQEPAVGPRLDWVVAGGESGPGARAVHPSWIRSLRDQCADADVPFLFKQWGDWGPAPFIVRVCDPSEGWKGTAEELAAAKTQSEAAGATHVHTGNFYMENGEKRWHLHEIGHKPWSLERVALPDGMEPIRHWGKKRAGRELDGREHNGYPADAGRHVPETAVSL